MVDPTHLQIHYTTHVLSRIYSDSRDSLWPDDFQGGLSTDLPSGRGLTGGIVFQLGYSFQLSISVRLAKQREALYFS